MRTALKAIIKAALATTLLGVVAACSAGGFGAAPPTATYDDAVKTRVAERNYQPTRTPIPTSTPFFVKREPTLIGTAGPTSTPTPTFTPEPTPTPNPLSADLAPVLLAVEDLPTGWTVSQGGLEVELTRTDNVCGSNIADPAVVDMQATYEASLTGPFATQGLSLYDNAGNAAAVLAQLRDAYAACPPEGYTYPDGSWAAISPLSFPTVGEESLSVRLSASVDGYEFESDLIVFRVDEVIVMVSYVDFSGLLGTPGAPSQLEAIVRSAEARVHAHAAHIDAIQVPLQTI